MKKTVAMMVASAGLLMAAPGQGMMMGQGMQMSKCQCNGMKKKMMMKKHKRNAPFLINHGLPHLTKMIMPYMNDPVFNLTPEQKTKLAAVRKETLGTIKQIKPQVMQLKKEIVQASTSGASADSLKTKVEKLASLEAKATMIHLKCIEQTKDILTKDQLLFLLANKNKMKKHGKSGMKRGGKGMGMQKPKMMMKCTPGKCGGNQ
jgi:Spy/CpxP family protein refolding chaperone